MTLPISKLGRLTFQSLLSQKYSVQNMTNPKLPISKLGRLTFQSLSVKKYSVQK